MTEISDTPLKPRFWRDAIRRGLRLLCPACGQGRVLVRYLTPIEVCSKCGTSFSAYRADDAPAYVTLLVVGHLVIAAMVLSATWRTWSLGWNAALWLPLTLGLILAILPRVKGALIGMQWALDIRSDERH